MAEITITVTIPDEKRDLVRQSIEKVVERYKGEETQDYLTRIVQHYLTSLYKAGYAQVMAEGAAPTDLVVARRELVAPPRRTEGE